MFDSESETTLTEKLIVLLLPGSRIGTESMIMILIMILIMSMRMSRKEEGSHIGTESKNKITSKSKRMKEEGSRIGTESKNKITSKSKRMA